MLAAIKLPKDRADRSPSESVVRPVSRVRFHGTHDEGREGCRLGKESYLRHSHVSYSFQTSDTPMLGDGDCSPALHMHIATMSGARS